MNDQYIGRWYISIDGNSYTDPLEISNALQKKSHFESRATLISGQVMMNNVNDSNRQIFLNQFIAERLKGETFHLENIPEKLFVKIVVNWKFDIF